MRVLLCLRSENRPGCPVHLAGASVFVVLPQLRRGGQQIFAPGSRVQEYEILQIR
jgi:hypothetical protein